ncbi:MAG: P-loop NTPase [Candidatus Micrarchaeota archaeon]|nr:P-loop NTPase [Candidatus Micrarchaeota archaeon]MDE1834189.1 P-loop NTPase [Candidatus Micrarchaeota archaeon]MDE1859161.1 P-loop NTPase [Candidatus Micrarchaeota archaeon]
MATKKSFVILMASQKGGVGKTTLAINLAIALRYLKYDVLLIDSDIATYSISEHLGIKGDVGNYQEALEGNMEVKDAIFAYQPLNLYLILGNLDKEIPTSNPDKINKFYGQVTKLGYDFVIIDGQPGPFSEVVAKYVNDVIIVTNPDSTSTRSAAKLGTYCDKFKLTHRLVINRAGQSKFELETENVEKLYGDVFAVVVPEDRIIQESLQRHKPAYIIDKGASFSLAVDDLARIYTLKKGESNAEGEGPESDRKRKPGFFQKVGGWVVGR